MSDTYCLKCATLKPDESFYVIRGRPRSPCIACTRARLKQKYEEKRQARLAARVVATAKVCTACGAEKPFAAFDVIPTRGTLHAKCHDCLKAYYQQKNREYGQKRAGVGLEQRRQRYAERRTEINALRRASRAARHGHYRERERIWQRSHRDYIYIRSRLRRDGWNPEQIVESVDRDAVVERDGGVCYLCGCVPEGKQRTLDHVIPLTRGGLHQASNLRVACMMCNRKKRTRLPSELAWFTNPLGLTLP